MNGKRESRAGILSQFQVRKRKKGNDFTYKLNAFFFHFPFSMSYNERLVFV